MTIQTVVAWRHFGMLLLLLIGAGVNAFVPSSRLTGSMRYTSNSQQTTGAFPMSSTVPAPATATATAASRISASATRETGTTRVMMSSSPNSDEKDDNPIAKVFSPRKDGVPSSPLDRPVLSAIDATSLLVFAGVGKASHSAVDGSLDVFAVLVTAFPFLVSWFLVSPLVGSFTPEATKDVKSAAVQSAKGWILAIPLGCILRGVIKGYVPPLPFVIVTMIATLVILSMGRVGYTVLSEIYVEMF